MRDIREISARVADAMLETTIVGSFTWPGYRARRALYHWDQPSSMAGQVAVITGGTSGIGRAAAEGLLRLGAEVLLTSRSRQRAEDVAAELREELADTAEGPPAEDPKVSGHALDTGSFESIDAFVRDIAGAGKIDVLINNAGALTAEYETDARGMELTLSTHLVGPYLLTTSLRPNLGSGARVLWMSSGGMYTQGLDVDRLEMSERSFRGAVAYARAKRAQVEMVAHLAPQWAPEVIMHTMHPGWVDTAGVDAGLPGFGKVMGPLLRDAHQGADTAVWLAATGGQGAPPGEFWFDRRPRRTVYLPGTAADAAERQRLVEWLDLQILPATVATGPA